MMAEENDLEQRNKEFQMMRENLQLKAALKNCRKALQRERGIGSWEFSRLCNIDRVQLSQWTAEPMGEPDLID